MNELRISITGIPPMNNAAMPGIDRKVIPSDLFKIMAWVLTESGKRADELTDGTELNFQEILEDKAPVSFRQAMTMIDNGIKLSNNPGLGFAIATREALSPFTSMHYALISCKCGQQALNILQRYQRISTFLTRDNIKRLEQQTVFQTEPDFPAGRHEPFIVECALSTLAQFPRKIFQDDNFHPHSVHFRYNEPSYSDRYQEVFQCPIYFNAKENSLIWNNEDLERPFPSHNPATAEIAIHMCDKLMGEQSHSSLASQIRLRLMETPSQLPSMQDIADEFEISARSLRRMLKEEGTSLQKIFDDVRKTITIEYLKNSNLTLEDIAALVGYGSAGNFHRAFKKWTGKSPSAYRQLTSR